MPKKIVEPPPLEIFEWGKTLNNLLWLYRFPCFEQEVVLCDFQFYQKTSKTKLLEFFTNYIAWRVFKDQLIYLPYRLAAISKCTCVNYMLTLPEALLFYGGKGYWQNYINLTVFQTSGGLKSQVKFICTHIKINSPTEA